MKILWIIGTGIIAIALAGCIKDPPSDAAGSPQISQLSNQIAQLSAKIQVLQTSQELLRQGANERMDALYLICTNLLSARYADEAAISTNAGILWRYEGIVDQHSGLLHTHALYLRALTNCLEMDENYLVGVSNSLSIHSDALIALMVMQGRLQNESQENIDLQRQRNAIMAIQAELMNESLRDQEINQVIKETIPTSR